MAALETQTGILRVSGFVSRPRLFFALLVSTLAVVVAFYFDATALSWVADHQTSGCLAFMQSVSRWGDWPAHVALGLVLALIAYARGSQPWLRIFVAMLVACALAGTAARVIKIGTGRARPSVQADAGWNGPRLSAKFHAFPSGHTASSTAFFAVLAFASGRHGIAFLILPLLIAFSRVYVGAHHLSDVICAALLGAVVARFVSRSRLLAEHRSARLGPG